MCVDMCVQFVALNVENVKDMTIYYIDFFCPFHFTFGHCRSREGIPF